ncbi:MAG TPA: M50 family metallopeptidase [Gemmataceae bacterium]|nr:M50 family metallopeptidase [Gemmataceae bacterium]
MSKWLENLPSGTALAAITVPCSCQLHWQVVVMGMEHGLEYTGHISLVSALSLVAVVTIHECGHVLAALVTGFRLSQITIGPWQLVREGRRLRPRLNRSLGRPVAFVQAAPINDRNLRRRVALYVSGGILANVVTGAACLLLAEWLNRVTQPPDIPRQPAAWRTVALLMPRSLGVASLNVAAILTLGVALQNLVPVQRRGHASDGTKLLDLLSTGPRAERRLLPLTLTAALLRGERPKAWKPDEVERLLALRDGSAYDGSANLFAYYYFVDTGQIERAGQFVDLFVAQLADCPAGHESSLFLEAAYFVGFHRRDPVQARAWLIKSAGGQVEKQTRLRAEAAVLLAEGRCEEAAAVALQGLAAAPESADPGGAIAEAEWLENILTAAKQQGPKQHPFRA